MLILHWWGQVMQAAYKCTLQLYFLTQPTKVRCYTCDRARLQRLL
jgi:hypothetical protein